MATPQVQSTAGSLISGFGLAGALLLGAVWTGMAVVDGNMVATAVRFLVAIVAGLFYLILFRVARRPVV
ncbi:MAG: hypothetical protein OES24_22250 [Acidimicrobiia bacterium]|nr:hypothetical protein [Acidimicrobiia bacterium]